MRHDDVILKFLCHSSTRVQRSADVRMFVFLSFPPAGMGMWDRIIMGKYNESPDLVCENLFSLHMGNIS